LRACYPAFAWSAPERLTSLGRRDVLGFPVEHANPALGVLCKDGVARLQKGRLDILDRAAMENIAGWDGPPDVEPLALRRAVS
jgi:hypothetical protein